MKTEIANENLDNPVLAISTAMPHFGEGLGGDGSSIGIPIELCDQELLRELSQIPDRMGFKIGDVAELVGVKSYVLRYWETEFDLLHPKKSKSNQRIYSRRDVENVMLIKKLLYRDRFSIEGARSALKQLRSEVRKNRDLQTAQGRIDQALEGLEDLIRDIHQFKKLFY